MQCNAQKPTQNTKCHSLAFHCLSHSNHGLFVSPHTCYSNYIFRRDNLGEPKTKLPSELVMTQNSMYCTQHTYKFIKAQHSKAQNKTAHHITLHAALTLLYSLHWCHRLLVKCFILNNLNCMPNNEHSLNIVFIQDDIATRFLSFPLKHLVGVLTGVFFFNSMSPLETRKNKIQIFFCSQSM